MVEPKQNQALSIFVEQLHRLTLMAGNTSCADSINELVADSFEISDHLGPSSSYYFEIPSKYVVDFLKKYEKESKKSPDVALALLSETIDNIGMYFQGLLTMVRKVSAKKPGIEPQPHPVENPVIDSGKSSISPDPQEKKSFFKTLFGGSKVEAPKSNMPSNISFINQQPACCSIEKNGLVYETQAAFGCETCGIKGGAMICQDCASRCHTGHKLINRGQLRGYCDCRFVTTTCKLQAACTFKYSGPKHIAQQKFSCRTCRMDPQKGHMMCQYCADQCHKGHDIVYNGKTESGYCDCKSLYSFCHLNKRY